MRKKIKIIKLWEKKQNVDKIKNLNYNYDDDDF